MPLAHWQVRPLSRSRPQASLAGAPHTHVSALTPLRLGGATNASVTNGRVTLTVSSSTGWLSAYADSVSGASLPLAQSWRSYVGANGSSINGSTQASVSRDKTTRIDRPPTHPPPLPPVGLSRACCRALTYSAPRTRTPSPSCQGGPQRRSRSSRGPFLT